jgi:hypothetical protein
MIKTFSQSFFLLALFFVHACKKDNDKKPDPPPAPIAFYKLDGNTKNSMSNLLHASKEGAAIGSTDSFNVSGSCYMLSGDGWLKVVDSDILDFPGNQFTIAAWIYPAKTSACYIINKAASSGAGGPYTLDIYPGVVRAFITATTKEQFVVEGTTKIVKNVWQHIAVTFSGTQLTVYYNGKAEASKPVDRPLGNSTGDLGIGASPYYFPSVAYEGKLDNIKIYDKGLTADQVMDLYKNYNQ